MASIESSSPGAEQNRAVEVVASRSVTLGVATSLVICRMYTKIYVTKCCSWDDHLMVIALVSIYALVLQCSD